MGREQKTYTALPGIVDHTGDGLGGRHVEGDEGFVEQNQRWLAKKSHNERCFLQHSARICTYGRMHVRTHTEGFDQRIGLMGGGLFGIGHPADEFMGGEERRERRFSFGIIYAQPVGHHVAATVEVVDRDSAFVGQHTRNGAKQGGFTRPVRAFQPVNTRWQLPFWNGQNGSSTVGFLEVMELNQDV